MTYTKEVVDWLKDHPGASYTVDAMSYLKLVNDDICSYDLWYYRDEDYINVPEWDVHVIGHI